MLTNKIDPISGKLMVHSDHKTLSPDNKELTLLDMNVEEYDDMATLSNARRKALKLVMDQDLLISVAWYMPQELQLVNLYPEVVIVDVV